MGKKRMVVKVVEIGCGKTKYVRLPRRDPMLQTLARYLRFEIRVERDPEYPENPLAYRIVLVPVQERLCCE